MQQRHQTVLIADDAPVNRKILMKLLSPEYDLLEAENGEEALRLLRQNKDSVSAVILDLMMPVLNGFDFLRLLQEDGTCKNLPIIVATGQDGEEWEAEALRLGAWDFITKPYNGEIIRFRLRNAIERSQLSALHQLRYLAEFDTLTGIYNKEKFFQATREMLDACPQGRFAFIRADIDRFQLVNSFFGMEEGDRLLRYLANVLSRSAKGKRFVYGRMEADVFAFCYAYEKQEDVIAGLERSKEYVKAYNHSFDIVPTYGLYFLDDLTVPVSAMLDRAALAARTCKGSYVNTIGIYEFSMTQKLKQEQEIINQMVAALEQKQFVIYLQPKYDLSSNLPSGGEALVRWQHPVKGLISPGVFIPVFEKNGFIAKLDYYVWESVCQLLHVWREQGKNPAPISVNISRANLYNPNTVQMIDDLVRKYAIPPELLQLELTESAYMINPQMMEHFTQDLHQRGFTVLMDDFGSGYSSLSVLKNIPVDVLKIDMRFFEDTKVHGRGENIIANVIRMAKWLNMPTVAEGVEKPEQVSFLRSVGCDYVQGFYFARPMPVETYQELMSSGVSAAVETSGNSERFDVDMLWSTDPEIEMLFLNATQASCLYEFDHKRLEIIRVNKAFSDLFSGCNPTAPMDDIVAMDRAAVRAAFQKCADEKENEECVYRRKDGAGRLRWVGLRLQYVCTVGGNHIVMAQLADITSQKKMEFELKRFRSAIAPQPEHMPKLLIIDDEESGVSLLRCIFERNYQILTAADGKEGLALLKEHKDDLAIVLLNMMIPVMDGWEFLLRKNLCADTAGIPVIVISADGDSARQADTLGLGVNDYVTKPFAPEVVRRRVQNVLDYEQRFTAVVKKSRTAAQMLDEQLFAINQVYTVEEMRKLQLFLSPLFDVVRLVDPDQMTLASLTEDGSVAREPYRCFRVWGKNARCENCTTQAGMRAECCLTKYELIQNSVFYVVSKPVLLEDAQGTRHRLSMEIISHVSDHVMLGQSGGKTVEELVEETQQKIYTDELTGVYNRRYLSDMLFIRHSQTDTVHQMALVMLDLRNFQQINDRHGHAIGDDVLARATKALTSVVRQSDSVIRYGGDEWIVVLTNCTQQQAQNTMERMRGAIGGVRYGQTGAWTAEVDCGCAFLERFDFQKETLEQMIQIADEALRREKAARQAKA